MSKKEQKLTKFEPTTMMLAFAEHYVREKGNISTGPKSQVLDNGFHAYFYWLCV